MQLAYWAARAQPTRSATAHWSRSSMPNSTCTYRKLAATTKHSCKCGIDSVQFGLVRNACACETWRLAFLFYRIVCRHWKKNILISSSVSFIFANVGANRFRAIGKPIKDQPWWLFLHFIQPEHFPFGRDLPHNRTVYIVCLCEIRFENLHIHIKARLLLINSVN